MKDIQKVTYDSLKKVLDEIDQKSLYKNKAEVPEINGFRDEISQAIRYGKFTEKTVLGIDIYQYSQFASLEQSLVPFLFKLLYKETAEMCLKKASFIFQGYERERFRQQFIDSGDGGFQIFETPLHAIAFAINFELFVRYYNAYQFYPKLRELIGPLSLRYALALDQVFQFDNNYYGPCIINCNRILSKDELNRFLMDENTFNWFMLNMSGVENLQILSIEEIKRIKEFQDYDVDPNKDSMFPIKMDYSTKGSIIAVDVQKIGKIESKSSYLSIYNLHMQYMGGMPMADDPTQLTTIAITLGNLNTSGIG